MYIYTGNCVYVLPSDDNEQDPPEEHVKVLLPLIAYGVEVLNATIGWPMLKVLRKYDELPKNLYQIKDKSVPRGHCFYPCIRVSIGSNETIPGCYGVTNIWRFTKGHKYGGTLSYVMIKLNFDVIRNVPDSLSCICHELGHALGLGHFKRPIGGKPGCTKEMMEVGQGAVEGGLLLVGEETKSALKKLYPNPPCETHTLLHTKGAVESESNLLLIN
jgi:hypothetical protein